MSNPYLDLVGEFVACLHRGRQLPLGGFPASAQPVLAPEAPVTLVFSPHPDDESIIGALPLRLRREAGHRVVVVAVTLGSNLARQPERLEELRGACGYLGFELVPSRDGGMSGITPAARAADPVAWASQVGRIAQLLEAHRPALVVLPHAGDGHPTHQGTHHLVMDGLRLLGDKLRCKVAFTEFWAAQAEPNLLVASGAADVADLMAAISFHAGEVRRNPYHVLLPSWMADNVRRGSELIGGQGGAALAAEFATLYRSADWDGRSLSMDPNRVLGVADAPVWLGGPPACC
jgi:LmbE family N-acetylglucosaminyl deacetylase